MANLEVKLVKSLIGSKKDQIATASSLGLRKIGDKATCPLYTFPSPRDRKGLRMPSLAGKKKKHK